MLTISVVFIIKDGAPYISYLDNYFTTVERLYKHKYNFEYFVYENDSNDDTVRKLVAFFKNRKGRYWSESIKHNADFKGIKHERCQYMSALRNSLKRRHGQLLSDYTLLIDCDVIFQIDIIDNLIEAFSSYNFYVGPSEENIVTVDLPTEGIDCECIPTNRQQPAWTDTFKTHISGNKLKVERIDSKCGWGQPLEFKITPPNVVAVTSFDYCYKRLRENHNNHYYDTLAFIPNNNIDYSNNGNSCMFENCERCQEYRTRTNIKFDNSNLLSEKKVTTVNSAFGGCFMLKTNIYNKVDWGDESDSGVCEHHTFCKKIRQFGYILFVPNLKVITTIPKLRLYPAIEKRLQLMSVVKIIPSKIIIKIPSIVHLIYLPWERENGNLKPDENDFNQAFYNSFQKENPKWLVLMWTQSTLKNFTMEYYPKYYDIWERVKHPTQVVDFYRLLVTYHFGGIYWQYGSIQKVPLRSFFPPVGKSARFFVERVLTKELNKKLKADVNSIQHIRNGKPEEPIRVANQCFCVYPRDDFLKFCIKKYWRNLHTYEVKNQYDILYIGANAMISEAYDEYPRKNEFVLDFNMKRYIKVVMNGSWRLDKYE
jgi:hypothetical protein